MEKGKVVVIDDSPIVRKLAEMALEEEGYKVYTAEDGEEGLKIAGEVSPSVILVDFIMPRMSGYQFCKIAQGNESLKDVPIILITGKGEDVGKSFTERFGVVDYFIKPFKSESLVEKVNSIIESQRIMAAGVETVVRAVPEPVAVPEPPYTLGIEEPAMQEVGVQAITEPEPVVVPEPPYTLGIEEPAVQEAGVQAITEPEPVAVPKPPYTLGVEELPVQETEVQEEAEPATAEPPYAFDIGKPSDSEAWMRFCEGLPFLVQKSIFDVLKQSGVIKEPAIIFSGDLLNLNFSDILRLIDANKLTGKLFVYSSIMSAEIYFDAGRIVYAVTSRQGRYPFSEKMPQNIIYSPVIKDSVYEAINSLLKIKSGSFFFEKMVLTDNLLKIPVRLDVASIVLSS